MPQATMYAEWCDPCRRSKGSARRVRGVAHTNEMICTISSAGHVFKRVLRKSRRNPWKGSSEVLPSDPYMAHGSIKRWEGKQKCFFFPLREYNASIPRYPYTWAQPVSLGIPCWSPRRLGMLGSNLFRKLWVLLKLKNRKHKQLKKLNQNIW